MSGEVAGDHLRDTSCEKPPRARSAEIVKQPSRTLRVFRGRRPRVLELPNWPAVATMEDRLSHSGDAIGRNQTAGFLPSHDDCGEFRTQWNYSGASILADLAGDSEFVAVDHIPC